MLQFGIKYHTISAASFGICIWVLKTVWC